MSQLGHSRPNWPIRAMSVIPLIATELRTSLVVRFVPTQESILSLRVDATEVCLCQVSLTDY